MIAVSRDKRAINTSSSLFFLHELQQPDVGRFPKPSDISVDLTRLGTGGAKAQESWEWHGVVWADA